MIGVQEIIVSVRVEFKTKYHNIIKEAICSKSIFSFYLSLTFFVLGLYCLSLKGTIFDRLTRFISPSLLDTHHPLKRHTKRALAQAHQNETHIKLSPQKLFEFYLIFTLCPSQFIYELIVTF